MMSPCPPTHPPTLDSLSSEALRERCAELEERLFWLETIIQGTRAGTWQWNVQTGETRFNERWAEIVGYRLEDLEPVTIDTWMSLAHPEDLARSEAALDAHFAGEAPFYACEARMRHRDGHWVWVRDYGRLVTRTAEGEPEWMSGTHIDISEHKATESRLEQALEETRQLTRTLERAQRIGRLGYWRASLKTGELFWSDSIYDLFGVERESFLPSIEAFKARVHPDDLPAVEASEARAQQTGIHDVQHRIIRPDGSIRWVHEVADFEPHGDEAVLVGTVRDITEAKELELRLRELSITDELTGLYNRRYFMQRLREAFAQCQRKGTRAAVIVFDFDHFKSVNDTHGHAAGDRVLRRLGRLLSERLRRMDVPGRLGGEEFAILLPETPLDGGLRVAEDIRREIAALELSSPQGAPFRVSITCGVDALAETDASGEEAIQRADAALYRGKHAGRNRVEAGPAGRLGRERT
ncbi:diguanylate cyclase [Halomonas organivorans]